MKRRSIMSVRGKRHYSSCVISLKMTLKSSSHERDRVEWPYFRHSNWLLSKITIELIDHLVYKILTGIKQNLLKTHRITVYRSLCCILRGLKKCQHIRSKMRMKNSAGEECVMKFVGSREGFHRVCTIDDSSSE